MTDLRESPIIVNGNSGDQPLPQWEAQTERLRSVVQKISAPGPPDQDMAAQLAESFSAIQSAIEELDQSGEAATAYTNHRRRIPNALACATIRQNLMVAERYLDGRIESPPRPVLRSLLYPSERILAINRSLRIDIFIKQPLRSTCESLIRAFHAGEVDAESFLAWFAERTMGLLGPELAGYAHCWWRHRPLCRHEEPCWPG